MTYRNPQTLVTTVRKYWMHKQCPKEEPGNFCRHCANLWMLANELETVNRALSIAAFELNKEPSELYAQAGAELDREQELKT